jgi:hypothetical protein
MQEYLKAIRQWRAGILTNGETVWKLIQYIDPDRIAECISQADAELIAAMREHVEHEPSTEAGWKDYWANLIVVALGVGLMDVRSAMPEQDRLAYQSHSETLRHYFKQPR